MELDIVELTWGRTFKVWWLVFWRTTVLGSIIVFFWDVLLPPNSGFIVIMPILFIVIRMLLKKRFSDFRIVLVKTNNESRDK
jgi:hypothetical protein